jgi:hypothetical protein
MGFLGRLFGFPQAPAERITQARKLLAKGEYNEARFELEGLEGAEAEGLLREALGGLVELNLKEARARMAQGDRAVGAELLELARGFGATPEQLRDARAQIRIDAEAAAKEAREKAQAQEVVESEGDDPLWGLAPDDPRLRYALTLETWPEDLRTRLVALGPDYARAVMRVDDGAGAEVLAALQAFAQKDPAAGFDLARAASQARRLELASEALKEFAQRCGHRQIGSTHTAVLLSQLLAAHGQAGEALDNLDAELKKAPNLSLRASRAGLLEAMGRPQEAGKEAEALIAAAPKEQSLYRLLARTREQQGQRPAAAAALEAGLACTCGSPGKCGNQAFDVEAGRMLARLYLEDRAEPARAQELLKELSQNVQEPTWEDHYLTSLLARNDGDPKAPQMALQLAQALRAGDPRKAWLEKSFPGMIG